MLYNRILWDLKTSVIKTSKTYLRHNNTPFYKT